MTEHREDRIRRRAHELWEQEGSPEGRQDQHWRAAEREIDAKDGRPDIREGRDASDDASLAAAPEDVDAKLDVGLDESFPASDPPAQTAPKTRRGKSALSDPGSPGGTAGTGGTANEQDR